VEKTLNNALTRIDNANIGDIRISDDGIRGLCVRKAFESIGIDNNIGPNARIREFVNCFTLPKLCFTKT